MFYNFVYTDLGNNPNITNSYQITNVFSLISTAIGWGLIIGALVLFFCIIIYGIQWLNAGGDSASVTSARTKITNCLFGFAILSVTYAIAILVQYFLGISVLQSPGTAYIPPIVPSAIATPTPLSGGPGGGPPPVVPPTPTPTRVPTATPTPGPGPSSTIDLNGTTTIKVTTASRDFAVVGIQPSNPTPYIHTYITSSEGVIAVQHKTQAFGGNFEFRFSPASLGVGNYTWYTYFCQDYTTWCSEPVLIQQVPFQIVP